MHFEPGWQCQVRKCSFAPFHFRLSWLQQLPWLAHLDMPKCNKGTVLHFCAFGWDNWRCKTAKMENLTLSRRNHRFRTFPLLAGTAGMGKERVWWLAQAGHGKVHFCTFGWYGWQCKIANLTSTCTCNNMNFQFGHMYFLHIFM